MPPRRAVPAPRLALAALLAAVLFALLAAAGPASAAPVTCGQTITQTTTLDADLSCPDSGSTEPALRIGKAGITLDLNGHKITANGRGIVNDGFANVTVRNGTIGANHNSILFTGVKWNVLTKLTLQGIVDGLRVDGGDHNWVVDNEAQGVTFGVRSNRSVVARNHTTGSEGLLGVGGDRNLVIENTTGGGQLGVSGAHNQIERNRVDINQIPSNLTGLTDSVFRDNVIVGDQGSSTPTLVVTGSSRNRFRGNALFRGRLVVESGSDNVFRRNVVHGSTTDGFLIQAAATGTQLINNLAVHNGDDGIDVEAPGTLIERNTADQNTDLGIEAVAGVVDGGGNKASGNGNPLGCTGVVCQ
jgi:Right handed beta helix region